MRHLKTLSRAVTIVLMVLAIVTVTGCKKETTSVDELYGSWSETSIDASHQRSLAFERDGSFAMILYTGNASSLSMLGTFTITDGVLKVHITKHVAQTAGQSPVTTTVNDHQLYENATFRIKGDILTLKYTTYPADAPVTTTATFTRYKAYI